MKNDDLINDLNDIKKLMKSASNQSIQSSGWFLILWGLIWLIGFTLGQLFFKHFQVIWITLNVLGIGISILLSRILYGKNKQIIFSGVLLKIFLVSVGMIIFDAIIVWIYGIKSPEDMTLLIILSASLCFFMIGVFKNYLLMFSGALLGLFCVIGFIFFQKYLYIYTGISCGSVLILSGMVMLGKK